MRDKCGRVSAVGTLGVSTGHTATLHLQQVHPSLTLQTNENLGEDMFIVSHKKFTLGLATNRTGRI